MYIAIERNTSMNVVYIFYGPTRLNYKWIVRIERPHENDIRFTPYFEYVLYAYAYVIPYVRQTQLNAIFKI